MYFIHADILKLIPIAAAALGPSFLPANAYHQSMPPVLGPSHYNATCSIEVGPLKPMEFGHLTWRPRHNMCVFERVLVLNHNLLFYIVKAKVVNVNIFSQRESRRNFDVLFCGRHHNLLLECTSSRFAHKFDLVEARPQKQLPWSC
eukprot:CAMPEP_0171486338 /NCGR_PEP_ID=MMETSP0958-20121227/1039_1 /TAXON_ID=87120 /ORGANISM="Aurantiochytrium limacinum, Strain ATCCMYA-1381" /LENGTH=145 /DNA_ID=CAMNT_0012019215 /DNA_START=455 /DNA_END=895 /DNA_ORIENTATION=+